MKTNGLAPNRASPAKLEMETTLEVASRHKTKLRTIIPAMLAESDIFSASDVAPLLGGRAG